MKLAKRILVTSVAVFSVFAVFSIADASKLQAGENLSKALEFINDPCGTEDYKFTDRKFGPDVFECTAPTGKEISIYIPVPWMADQEPELGLVSLPIFIAVTWDETSFAYKDTDPVMMYEYPSGNPTERLYGLEFQMRVKPQDWWVTLLDDAGVHVGNVNFRSDQQSQMGMYRYNEETKLADASYSNPTTIQLGNICAAGAGPKLNQVLAVPEMWGGYGLTGSDITVEETGDLQSNVVCKNIFEELDSNYFDPIPLSDTTAERYPDWRTNALQPQAIIAFSEIASMSGSGEMYGAPAYEITATTNVIIEARVFWTRHEHKYMDPDWDCNRDYWNDYDEIKWEKWPDIFCKKIYVPDWKVFCKPEDQSCYGKGVADSWWQQIGIARGNTIKNQFGGYAESYEIVVLQAQPLLDAP